MRCVATSAEWMTDAPTTGMQEEEPRDRAEVDWLAHGQSKTRDPHWRRDAAFEEELVRQISSTRAFTRSAATLKGR